MAGPLDPRLVRRATATKGFLVAVALVGVVTAFLVLAQARLLSDVVAHVFDTHNTQGIAGLVGILMLVFVARAGLSWLSQWLAHRASAAVKSQLRMDLMKARLARPIDASTPTATLITLVTQGLDALDGYFAKYLPQLMMAATVPLVIGVAILTQDIESTVIIIITMPLIPLFMALIGKATQNQVDRRFKVQTRLANHFADVVAGLPTLQVFGRAKAQLVGLRRTEDAHRTETMKTLRLAFLSSLVLELLATLSVALVAVSMGFRVVGGHFDLRTSLFVLILTPEVYLPIRQVGVLFHDSADGTAAANKAFELIEAAERESVGGPAEAPNPGEHPIIFDDLSVVFPAVVASDAPAGEDKQSQSEKPALSHFSCRIEPGHVVALRGRSGGGKSTALSVLMGFQRPTSGRILVGQTDLSDVDMDAWRAHIAYVSQDPGVINGTIASNIKLGYPLATDEQLRSALDRSGGEQMVLDHIVADEGEGLSSGERRRVALARALLRIELGGARLLVLDEPTAGLDQRTEALAIQAVRESGASALVVSHRPAVLETADEVIELASSVKSSEVSSNAAESQELVGQRITKIEQRFSDHDEFLVGGEQYPNSVVKNKTPATASAKLDNELSDGRVLKDWRELVSRLIHSIPNGRGRLATSIILAILATGSSIGLMGVAGWLLSRAAEHPPVLALTAAAVAVRTFGIGRAVFRYIERLVGHDLALRMEGVLRETVYRKLSRTTLLGRHRGDLLVRITADIEAVMDVVVRVVVPFVSSCAVTIIACIALVFLSPWAAVILLVAAIFSGIVMPWWGQKLSRKADEAAVPLRGELADQVRQIARCAPDLVAFGADSAQVAELMRIDGALRDAEARDAWTRGVASAGQMVSTGIAVCGGLLVGGRAVAVGHIAGRDLAVLPLVALALQESFTEQIAAAQTMTRARAALGRVIGLLSEPAIGRGDRDTGETDRSGAEALVSLSHLDIGWPGSGVVLRDVNVKIKPGQKVAVTGQSGIGKTTLAATVMGLIDPISGTVNVPDRVGYLAQDAHIFATSIAENVKIGDRNATDEQVADALQRAGLKTMDPKRIVGESGATLSGGEARRVAMARILVGGRHDQLVILDEPTEHLDAETAEALMDDVWSVTSEAAVLVITHDPELMAACDRCVDLEANRVD